MALEQALIYGDQGISNDRHDEENAPKVALVIIQSFPHVVEAHSDLEGCHYETKILKRPCLLTVCKKGYRNSDHTSEEGLGVSGCEATNCRRARALHTLLDSACDMGDLTIRLPDPEVGGAAPGFIMRDCKMNTGLQTNGEVNEIEINNSIPVNDSDEIPARTRLQRSSLFIEEITVQSWVPRCGTAIVSVSRRLQDNHERLSIACKSWAFPCGMESKHSNEMVALSGDAGSVSTTCRPGWFSVSTSICLHSSSDSIVQSSNVQFTECRACITILKRRLISPADKYISSGDAGIGATICRSGWFSISNPICLTSSSDSIVHLSNLHSTECRACITLILTRRVNIPADMTMLAKLTCSRLDSGPS
ncbi:hypothetical protein MAR_006894 [Mya arenaria]|uniref:Uncharacterized protein n=1 Tax=Mya arenaria TaxID=6604 RepID=A0ABY7DEB9_MYAAR|nr:hypothetical protein MAR_006894 [Mya arenaria]